MRIEAIHLSVGESQKQRSVDSVLSQTIPFHKVQFVSEVPLQKAYEVGWANLDPDSDYVLFCAGDMIYRPDAHALMLRRIRRQQRLPLSFQEERIYQYQFTMYDPFLQKVVKGVCVRRRQAIEEGGFFEDFLSNDTGHARKMMSKGFKTIRMFDRWTLRKRIRSYKIVERAVMGTHFESPSNFEVFGRFYASGVQSVWRGTENARFTLSRLQDLYSESEDSRYKLAIDAFKFGAEIGEYPTSQNIEFDREKWLEFRARNTEVEDE